MKKKYVILCCSLILIAFSIQNCLTDSQKKPEDNIAKSQNENGYHETFLKTGWIKDNKYRAVVFIITNDECKNSSRQVIEEKIKYEAFRNLQKELNSTMSRNASNQIKTLIDSSGKMKKPEVECVESNIYFYDLEKNDLKSDFEKIKNLK